MFFHAPTPTLRSKLITPHYLRYQPVLIEPFAVPSINCTLIRADIIENFKIMYDLLHDEVILTKTYELIDMETDD